jgi:hypothetical protein
MAGGFVRMTRKVKALSAGSFVMLSGRGIGGTDAVRWAYCGDSPPFVKCGPCLRVVDVLDFLAVMGVAG